MDLIRTHNPPIISSAYWWSSIMWQNFCPKSFWTLETLKFQENPANKFEAWIPDHYESFVILFVISSPPSIVIINRHPSVVLGRKDVSLNFNVLSPAIIFNASGMTLKLFERHTRTVKLTALVFRTAKSLCRSKWPFLRSKWRMKIFS